MSTPTAAPVMLPIDISAQAGPQCVLSCSQCATRIAHTSRIRSTAFRGHAGKAALFTEIRNVALDPPSILLMDSGAYTIQEFICKTCDAYLGWKIVRAHDGPERWKEEQYILELDLVQQQDDLDGEGMLRNGVHVQSRIAQSEVSLHKRTMSADLHLALPKGVRQGFRSLQQTQRRIEVDDPDDGPFWKPR